MVLLKGFVRKISQGLEGFTICKQKKKTKKIKMSNWNKNENCDCYFYFAFSKKKNRQTAENRGPRGTTSQCPQINFYICKENKFLN
jgi:hypothetical protein